MKKTCLVSELFKNTAVVKCAFDGSIVFMPRGVEVVKITWQDNAIGYVDSDGLSHTFLVFGNVIAEKVLWMDARGVQVNTRYEQEEIVAWGETMTVRQLAERLLSAPTIDYIDDYLRFGPEAADGVDIGGVKPMSGTDALASMGLKMTARSENGMAGKMSESESGEAERLIDEAKAPDNCIVVDIEEVGPLDHIGFTVVGSKDGLPMETKGFVSHQYIKGTNEPTFAILLNIDSGRGRTATSAGEQCKTVQEALEPAAKGRIAYSFDTQEDLYKWLSTKIETGCIQK